MLILISCSLLFITALALMVLQVTQPNARYSWLAAVGGAMLALVSVFVWLTQLPFELALPAWQPHSVFINPILFRADKLSWPFALCITALTLTILLTAITRSAITNSFTWAGTLALGGIGLLAVTATIHFPYYWYGAR
jgi:formate hydrogenlyase subunit 3/multisubunit Na+/H+ antiporter MnhD subunit